MKRAVLAVLWLVQAWTCGRELSEAEAVRMFLERNLLLRISALEVEQAAADERIVLSAFHPRVGLDAVRLSEEDGTTSYLEGSFSKMFSSGTLLAVNAGGVDVEKGLAAGTNRAASVMVRQALLKNAFGRASRRRAAAAEAGVRASRCGFLAVREEMVLRAVRAYWTYAAAVKAAEAESERCTLYRDLMSLVEKKRADGAVEEKDVLMVRSALLKSRAALREAEARRDRAERELAVLLNPEAHMRITPVISGEELVGEDAGVPASGESLSLLISRRPDIRRAEELLERMRFVSEHDACSALPALDLVVGYGTDSFVMYGGASAFNYLPPADAEPGWMVGISFSYTLGGGEDAGKAERDFLEVVKLRHRLRTLRREAVAEYMNSLQAYRAALEAATLMHRAVEADRKVLEAERRDLERARGTFERVVEAGDRYAASRAAYWRAVGNLRTALAALRKSCGVLAEHYIAGTRALREGSSPGGDG